MPGNHKGSVRTAAKRLGLSEAEYRQRVDAGEKYCWACSTWKPWQEFGLDRSRGDGLTAACRLCKNLRARELHYPGKRLR